MKIDNIDKIIQNTNKKLEEKIELIENNYDQVEKYYIVNVVMDSFQRQVFNSVSEIEQEKMIKDINKPNDYKDLDNDIFRNIYDYKIIEYIMKNCK